ncbi:glycosyltransferase [Paractinoplanes lichenicola]|uniref:Glycosyltransferase n=1 Tax=Paractinoplanes lichenicola TaxID=2802976 RepID=A0ABS1W6F3_9ACTN|nr:glycosyltransferase [Actinoplanes lichenicola]MBL7262305.1 glycosyltransferase [Actinoplanes lichenicola]
MRILVVACRFPEAGGKGDALRSFAFVRELASRHDVTVVTPSRPSSRKAEAALREHAVVEIRPTRALKRVFGAGKAALRGRPGQVGWMMPSDAWASIRALAPGHDVALAVTVRSIRGPLGIPTVLDHVDALSLNMRRRGDGPESPLRRFAARREALALARYERRAARWVDAQVVTDREDAGELPSHPDVTVIPAAWDGTIADVDGADRDTDVIFTGNMDYPPNRVAAEWLAHEIVPALRRRRPEARVMVVGRGAARLRLDGVEVASDVPNLADYLARAQVAVVPLRGLGTGSPNKLLEAAAGGAAVVATSWAGARFDVPCLIADDAEEFAAGIDRLLGNDAERDDLARRARRAIEDYSVARTVKRLETVLAGAAAAKSTSR